ncbi:eukaryotic translation initiation factor eIF2A-domain-containing protein [Schizophyllum amplum]|uniref:Eukaryotic translation initiation factor eIF2A-domain-containing protein n=1 Tax=Schizophyllum amplum TaxID=97359 RepID=A0A550BZ84_9AGAR|nr:eukaryotic translation initiation factor eIF2A-domain-containing protein [Auriculariopsis ampla]
MQYTISESHAIRLVGPEIQVFCPSEWSKTAPTRFPPSPTSQEHVDSRGDKCASQNALTSVRTTTETVTHRGSRKTTAARAEKEMRVTGASGLNTLQATSSSAPMPRPVPRYTTSGSSLRSPITIVDRRTLNKVTTIDAPNTSVCQWSPDGRFLLTATLSPRLRVDNGVMIWHCTGPLMHVQRTEELYQTGWRPARTEDVPPFPAQIPPAPAPSPSASQVAAAAKPVVSKGAYRPPGARGLAAPSIFKREDEGGAPRIPTNGTHSPQGVRSPEPRGVPGAGARRHVPGAPPPNHSPSPGPGDKKKRKGKKGGEEGGASGAATPTDGAATPIKGRRGGSPRGSMDGRPKPRTNGSAANVRDAAPPPAEEPQTDPSLDPVAKKVRNLTKKLKAIEELKEKAMRGERLEATQVKKIDGEGALKAELASLGA